MLLVLRDAQQKIQAAMEAQLVDEAGAVNPLGHYVWIEQLEVNPDADGQAAIKFFMQRLLTLLPDAVGAYWVRKKKDGGQKVHAYRRAGFARAVKGGRRDVVAMA